VGIDFGTSTTLVAEGSPAGRASVVPIGLRDPWLPSVATMDATGAVIVGEDAESVSPARLIRSVKRAITRRQAVVHSEDGSVSANRDDVIVAVLSEVVRRARENQLDVADPGAVRLGCPSMWDADQRRLLLDLAQKAGLAVGASTLIDEPIAAGLMWIHERDRARKYHDNDRVLIFDMGGGTLDVALLDVTTGPGREPEIYVLASKGVDEAGDRLDEEIAKDLIGLLAEHGVDFDTLDDPALARAYVQRAATEAKIALSEHSTTHVEFDYRGAKLPSVEYTVGQLNDCLAPQLQRAWALVDWAMRAALLTHESRSAAKSVRTTDGIRQLPLEEIVGTIDHVVLVGGMSRVPEVARYLMARLPNAEAHTFVGGRHSSTPGPQEAIAAGLAEPVSYEQVNLHLPGFDFVLDIPGRSPVTLYRAHTPFYEPWEAMNRTRVFYDWPGGATAHLAGQARDLPTSGSGTLRVRALDGSLVTMRESNDAHDRTVEGLRVGFGAHKLRFTLAPDGRMQIVDGVGTEQSLRITRWPALRSSQRGLSLRVEEPRWLPDERRAWDTK